MGDLQLALILAAVSPAIGGVLIRGEKGTAKSTAVRALTEILPTVEVIEGCRFSCDPANPDPICPDGPHAAAANDSGAGVALRTTPGSHTVPAPDTSGEGSLPAAISRPARLVELPVGATEDRVLGSLHLERALSEGVTVYEPGLLAAAHRGLLYVDEVNLLHDHLVDVLLDAAAMGRATVERDGVSITHPARFVLVGTMNPEEGELRPQLLDRFGLTVDVVASRDPAVRVEVMRARLTYEADPTAFIGKYAGVQAELSERIVKAQSRLADVILTDAALRQIAEICASFDVDGMRADLVTARTAVAHAAWSGRTVVEVEDVRAAAKLALPHRKRRNPFDAPGLDDEQLEQAIQNSTPPDPDPEDDPEDDPDGGPDGAPDGGPDGGNPDGPDGTSPTDTDRAPNTDADHPDATQPPADAADPDKSDNAGSALPGPAPTGQVAASSEPYKARLLSVQSAGAGVAGRRSRALTEVGRVVGDRARVGRESGRPHLLATIRTAAPHQHARGRSGRGLAVRTSDVRLAVREGREGNLVLFCVDASGSMGTKKRMTEVKTAIVSLLLDAYQRRDTVGLVTFAGADATVALPPTGSVETAVRRLESLPTGGRTPLAEGLLKASDVLRIAAIRDPRRRPLLVLVTDGRATAGDKAFAKAKQAAGWLAQQGIASVVLDCEPHRGVRLGLAAELAADLGAEYLDLGEVAAGKLVRAVTERSAA
ncbi:magnesium chelatase subunit D family protein [Streptomyces sp. SID13031]|uniref:magnesium chelatase subunit D family protein n=1 Tax=Streptomyces sp. SID13031 TaxID=2706046 RepID=UPI0013CC46A1|nr:magnesium chelatase subunit D family protein [Streptomyces sp. SID13031]NEA32961.1 magnesium chelatase subunit D family protein [Streptomyces sp. SID13031]